MAIENVDVRYAIPKKKYSKGCNCKFLDAEIALLRPLYCSSTLFKRKTNMWLAEMTVYKDSKVLRNNTFLTYIMIKIIFFDIDAILSNREILNKAVSYGNIYMVLLILRIEFIL